MIKVRKYVLLLLALFLCEGVLLSEPVSTALISEFLANNNKGIKDSDNENSDWIEIWNTSEENGDLGGYYY